MSSPPVQARTLAGVPRESRIIVATSENIPILRKLTTLELEEGASVSFFMSISRSRVLTRVHVKVETIDEIENEPVVVADFLAALDHLPPLMRAGDRIDVDASVAAHGLYELPNLFEEVEETPAAPAVAGGEGAIASPALAAAAAPAAAQPASGTRPRPPRVQLTPIHPPLPPLPPVGGHDGGSEGPEGAPESRPGLRDLLRVARATAPEPAPGPAADEAPTARSRATELTPDLIEQLEKHGIEGYAEVLRKMRILSLFSLGRYTVAELEAELRRPKAAGKDFFFSGPDRRSFEMLCKPIEEPVVPPPAARSRPPSGAPSRSRSRGASDVGEEAAEELSLEAALKALTGEGAGKTGSPLPGAEAGDSDEEADAEVALLSERAKPPAPASEPATPKSREWVKALARSPHVTALLGATGRVELSELLQLVKLANAALGGKQEGLVAAIDHEDLGSVVDLLESMLEIGAGETDAFSLAALKKVPASLADARKHLLRAAADKKLPGAPTETDKSGVADYGVSSMHGLLLDAASGGALNEKHAEEASASRERLKKVCREDDLRISVLELSKRLSTTADDNEKLHLFAEACNNNAEVVHLLFSSHVKEPKGALALTAGLRALAEAVLQIRMTIKKAVKARAREMMPANAEMQLLIDACFAGELAPKEGRKINLRNLAHPKARPSWLTGGSGEAEGSDHEPEQSALVYLFTVLPPLFDTLAVLHPHDPTIVQTLALICGYVSKGLKRNGVASAIDNVLSPFLRELEEAWDSFQKSTHAELPVFLTVWAKVQKDPSVAGYLAQALAPAASKKAKAPGSGTVNESDLFNRIIQKLEQRGTAPGGAGKRERKPLTAEEKALIGEKPKDAGPNWERNRLRRLKAKEGGGASTATSRATSPSPGGDDE